MSTTVRISLRHALLTFVALVLVGLASSAGLTSAQAAPPGGKKQKQSWTSKKKGDDRARDYIERRRKKKQVSRSQVRKQPVPAAARVIAAAAAQAGDPYVYGASGPNAFDCSGLTSFAYRVGAGKTIPRSSGAQRAATAHVSRADARPGDLVFFHGSSGVYHVGIYAGGNSLWHASRPGVPVGKANIWTSAVSFGRVR